jgi:hypothetical protein
MYDSLYLYINKLIILKNDNICFYYYFNYYFDGLPHYLVYYWLYIWLFYYIISNIKNYNKIPKNVIIILV